MAVLAGTPGHLVNMVNTHWSPFGHLEKPSQKKKVEILWERQLMQILWDKCTMNITSKLTKVMKVFNNNPPPTNMGIILIIVYNTLVSYFQKVVLVKTAFLHLKGLTSLRFRTGPVFIYQLLLRWVRPILSLLLLLLLSLLCY